MDPHDTHDPQTDGYWPNDWPGHDPAYDPDRASIDDECAGIFAEREPRSRPSGRSGHHRASDATWARARADYLAGESASVVCDRYGMRVSTLRNRAAEEGWRRQDQPEPEPVDLDAELEAGLPDYADMAAHALIRLNRAILKGHATEAGRWMRLHRTLLEMARKPAPKPVPQPVPAPNPLMDALEAQVAEIQAMARSLARGNSDGSDGKNAPPLPLDGGGAGGGGACAPAKAQAKETPPSQPQPVNYPASTPTQPSPIEGEGSGLSIPDPSDPSDGISHTPHPTPPNHSPLATRHSAPHHKSLTAC